MHRSRPTSRSLHNGRGCGDRTRRRQFPKLVAHPEPYPRDSLAGALGLEPRFTASKTAVLPLDDTPRENTNEWVRVRAPAHTAGVEPVRPKVGWIVDPLAFGV